MPRDLIDREQVPRLLRRLDDPWGITWRFANAVRRFRLGWAARWARAWVAGARHPRPIFVVGVPRSGTTLLFQLLRESEELGTLPGEGHDVWRTFHHPRYGGWRSDAVAGGEVKLGERRFVNACFAASIGDRRLLEKTPENALRIGYLLDLFPDARFVAIHRHPLDVISSLIDGWRHPRGRFRSYYVPRDLAIPGYEHRRRWCFALIEGWRELAEAPVPEIAFAQWRRFVEGLEEGRGRVAASHWTELHLERLLADPQGSAEDLYGALGIRDSRALRARLRDLVAHPVNASSPPGEEKWRRNNPREVRELLPRIAPLARTLGYEIDPESGRCEVSA